MATTTQQLTTSQVSKTTGTDHGMYRIEISNFTKIIDIFDT